MAPTVGIALLSVGSTAYSASRTASAHRKAGEETRRLSNMDAADQMMVTAEESRRLKNQQAEEESLALARASASGVDVGGSTSNLFLKSLTSENKKQLDWLKRSGLSKSTRIKEGGASAARTSKSEARATVAGGVASAARTAGAAYGSWYENKQAKTQ